MSLVLSVRESLTIEMQSKATVLLLVMVAAGTLAGVPARADIQHQLERARQEHRATLARVRTLEQELDVLLVRYATIERRAGHAAIRLVDRARAVQSAADAVADARGRLEDDVRATYELGPGSMLQAYLSAETFADLSVAHEYASRTLAFQASVLDRLERAEAALRMQEDAADRAETLLSAQRSDLNALLARMRTTLNQARRLAERSGVVVRRFEGQQHAIDEAAARESGLGLLDMSTTGVDQSALLELLGPTGGRTCETPDGLTDTGHGFSGDASWYGWDFAGQTTASGAIFDPRLFTAATTWLPFGTFLKIQHDGNCAIVLVNDRGPFVDGRVVDVSMAAAQYLDIGGVAHVTADILVPADGIQA